MGKKKNNHFKNANRQQPYKKNSWNIKKKNEKVFEKNLTQENNPKICLREDQVSITEFLSHHEGFKGVIKSRFSDFHVNEIDLQNKVLELTDVEIPEALIEEDECETPITEEDMNKFISPDIWTKLNSLACDNSSSKETINIDIGEKNKEQRTLIHKFFKKKYSGKLVSSTVSKCPSSNEKCIRIMKGNRLNDRKSWNFPGEYVYFLVHKENTDTIQVATAIANKICLRPSQVNYCGTKDKRAITTQRFCIKRRSPQQIAGAFRTLRNVYCGNFQFGDKIIKLGDLRGNRFRIALRHVSGNEENIELALRNVRERGFINYYGLQRFGNHASVPTYEIGIAILKSDYKLACELILKPRENENDFMQLIRETWWKNRNSTEAAAMFHNNKYIEKKLLDGLAQHGERDFATALRNLPRNMLMMYPHAFQSLIFNRIASRRIKEFGLEVLPGDLVLKNDEDIDNEMDDFNEGNPGEDVNESIDFSSENTLNEKSKEVDSSVFKRRVKHVTEEDIASETYNLWNVVLPQPGYDITYPQNIIGEWYEEMLSEFGLSSEKLRHSVKTYAIPGSYRKLLIKPMEMNWSFKNYDNAETTLIASDWEKLHKKENKMNLQTGKYRALILDFSLPTSTYATMLLRELMKADTSSAHQIQLEKNLKSETEG